LVATEQGATWVYEPVVIWPRDRPLGRAGTRFVELLAKHVGSPNKTLTAR
jgi:hypothetical protein